MRQIIGLTLLLVISMSFSACSRWSVERQDARAEALLGDSLQVGMSLQDFRAAYPNAKQVPGTDSDAAFLVTASDVCFWCYSGRGFKESEEVFGRIVHFENGTLSSSQAVHVGEEQ